MCFLFTDCSCAGKMPPGYIPDYDNDSEPFNPIATNGEPYPWLERKLPNTVRPLRYTLTIHPNLTTLDVKGNFLFVDMENISSCFFDFSDVNTQWLLFHYPYHSCQF